MKKYLIDLIAEQIEADYQWNKTAKINESLESTNLDRELIDAAVSGDIGAVRSALRNGADPTSGYYHSSSSTKISLENSAALLLAARNGEYDVVQLLLRDGRADPTANNLYALRHAMLNGDVKMVRILLDDGRVDINHSNPVLKGTISKIKREAEKLAPSEYSNSIDKILDLIS